MSIRRAGGPPTLSTARVRSTPSRPHGTSHTKRVHSRQTSSQIATSLRRWRRDMTIPSARCP
eukprot:12537257-Heterocapsa_arctica.AAC.1